MIDHQETFSTPNSPDTSKMFRAIVETTPDTVVIADANNCIIFCNEKIKQTFGYTPQEVLYQDLNQLIPPHYREHHRRGMQKFLDTRQPNVMGKTIELVGLRKDGTEFPIDLSLSYWEEAGAVYFSAIIRDITRRKTTENNLIRERQFLRTILEAMEDGIMACDENGNLTFFNRAARKLLGEKVDKDFQNFDARIRNFNLFYPSGKKLDRMEELPLYRVLHGDEFSAEEMEIKEPGKEKLVVLVSGRQIRTATGLNLGGVSIFQNITAIRQKEEELKKKNRIILSALEELKLTKHNLEKTNNQLEQRVAERTSQLQQSNQELNQKNEELQKINADLDNFVYIASHDLKARIEADFSQAPEIHFAAVNLKSILINLLSNAIKYRSPERAPFIQVDSYRQNGCLVLQVQDNGLGMDLARSGTRLFGMFTRLHNHVEGSGIGLYIVKRIVENHQGRIEVDSQVGEGTTFKVHLPQPAPQENAG
jgi:PAS domain S-box-containing protein